MKKFKIAFWILVFAFLALIIYQNKAFFQAPLSLRVNLVFAEYTTPELQIWVFFIALFFIGILLTYFFSLPARFKAGKNIRTLNATITSQRNELATLKNDVDAMRGPAPVEPTPGAPAPVGTDKIE
ncbi:MAG: LapA family protein [Desulfobacterales bacterium]|nr:LapA family protein [Desulfobacterales bacterium]